MKVILERVSLKLGSSPEFYATRIRKELKPVYGSRLDVRVTQKTMFGSRIEIGIRGEVHRGLVMQVVITPYRGAWDPDHPPPTTLRARMLVGIGLRFKGKDGTADGLTKHVIKWFKANAKNVAESIQEDTIPMILRRVGRPVRERAAEYTPRVSGYEKSRRLWFFEVGDYTVRLRAIPTKKRQERVERMEVRVKCSCPSWRWNGPEHWAMENKYQYGPPKGTADYPKINDPKMKHGACKHVTACLRYIQEKKLKIMEGVPVSMGDLLDQMSDVPSTAEDEPHKPARKKKHARLDRPFRRPHPGIQAKLQPPRGNSQHGPEQTYESEGIQESMRTATEKEYNEAVSRGGRQKRVMQTRRTFDVIWSDRGTEVASKTEILSGRSRKVKSVSYSVNPDYLRGGKKEDVGMTKMAVLIEQAQERAGKPDEVQEAITGGGAPVGDTENNWIIADVDFGGTISMGFGSREEADAWATKNNIQVIPEEQADRMEKRDPMMLQLKREHPNLVWAVPSSR